MIALNRIVVPTDFSDYGRLAVQYAAAFAEQFASELHLLHVIDDYFSLAPEARLMLPNREQYLHDREVSAVSELRGVHAAEASKIRNVVESASVGQPFVEIVRYARKNSADLIVMGSHGRTGLTHALLGSVAERVIRKANCPVLTVRPDQHRFVMP